MQARTNDRPRFRQDLVAESIDDRGSRFIDVMDPDSGSVFRFYEVEYSIACAMDGQRDIAGIVQWAKEELGVTPSPAEVRTVIATLGELGFIDGIDAGVVPAPRGVDNELARGVVVGDRADTVPGDTMDVELGEAGAVADGHVNNDMPRAPNLTLGASGPTAAPRHAPAEDIPLGMPGPGDITARITEPEIQVQPAARDVSLDLSDQMTVRPDDVKEAVRASKVMKAVEVPKDVLDALEAAELDPNAQTKVSPTPSLRPTPPPRPTPQPMPVAAPPTRPTPAAAVPVPARDVPPTRPTPAPVKPHVEKAAVATAADRPPIGAHMATRRTSPVLIIALIIVILGGGAFALWKFVLDSGSDDTSTKSSVKPAGSDVTTPAAVTPPKPEPPKATPAKAKLSTEPEAPEDLKAPVAGTIDKIEPNDTAVKPGDVIARLVGYKPIEAEITTLATDVDKTLPAAMAAAQKELDAATAANNAANVTAAQKKLDDAKKALDDKQAQLAAKKTELDKFIVKSASAGKLSAISKAGGKVLTDEVVARVAREPVLTASFDVKGSKLATGAAVKLTDDAKPDKSYDCTVAEVTADKLKVTCPSDPTLDGTEVTLANP